MTPIHPYEAPVLRDYGSIADLTAGNIVEGELDATFPTGTPQGDLRFS